MRKSACLLLMALPLLGQSNRELTRLYDEDQKERLNWQSLTDAEREAMSSGIPNAGNARQKWCVPAH